MVSIHRVLGYVTRPPFAFWLADDLLLPAIGGACLAIFGDRKIFAVSGILSLCACEFMFYDGEPLHLFCPCTVIDTMLLAAPWWQHSREK